MTVQIDEPLKDISEKPNRSGYMGKKMLLTAAPAAKKTFSKLKICVRATKRIAVVMVI